MKEYLLKEVNFNSLKPKSIIPKAISKQGILKIGKKVNTNNASEPLLKKARKYKSADEFVESQEIVYHGGKGIIDNIDLSKMSAKTPEGEFFYTTPEKWTAKRYGNKISEFYIDKNAKIADFKTIKVFRENESKLFKELEGDIKRYKGKTNNEHWNFKNKSGLLHTLKIQPELVSESPIILELLRKRGYQVLNTPSVYGGQHSVILDKSIIKTKSELTDIYNKATGK